MGLKTHTLTALVLRRVNSGEKDRLVTLLTQELGKVMAKAKGVRAHAAPRQSFLEPGHVVTTQITSGEFPIITQVQLISDAQGLSTLGEYRRFSLLLELYSSLFVAQEIPQSLFDELLSIRTALLTRTISREQLQERLREIVAKLGFPIADQTQSVTKIVSELTGYALKSHDFLQPR